MLSVLSYAENELLQLHRIHTAYLNTSLSLSHSLYLSLS